MDSVHRELLEGIAEQQRNETELADRCNTTIGAVRTAVGELRDAGFAIEETDSGYTLAGVPEYGEMAVAFGLEAPYDVIYRERIESTNAVARNLAETGCENVVVLANEQTAGRGRRGRSWQGPPGGIYLSILLDPSLRPSDTPLLTLAAAVATVEGIESVGGSPTIKWPNDLLIGDRKVAGILTETQTGNSTGRWAIVGIGVNANVPRTALPTGATSLRAAMGAPVDRRKIVQSLLESFHHYQQRPDEILPAWQARASTLGRRVRITTPTTEFEGIARAVLHPGTLEIETADGVIGVDAGDCEHLRHQGAGGTIH